MNKKHEGKQLDNEEAHKLKRAESDYGVGNFYGARALARFVLKSSDATPAQHTHAREILRKTGVDIPSLAIGMASLIFTGVVAYISAY